MADKLPDGLIITKYRHISLPILQFCKIRMIFGLIDIPLDNDYFCTLKNEQC